MIKTRWGYSVEELGKILSASEFEAMTGGRYSGDERIESLTNAATEAVRDYCGWHLYPSTVCTLESRAHSLRLIYVGNDTIIQIPARYVASVSSVTINGSEITDYSVETNGLLRLYDCRPSSRKDAIVVTYTAGLPDEFAGAVKELIGHRVTHGLAQSYGVQSEAAGGVSITYSANWINSARATALPDDNREVLTPYRLQGVF